MRPAARPSPADRIPRRFLPACASRVRREHSPASLLQSPRARAEAGSTHRCYRICSNADPVAPTYGVHATQAIRMKSDSRAGPGHPSPSKGRNDFLSVLAHEVRNRVAPIRNAVHLLRMRSRSDPDVQPLLEMIERQVAAIVNDLDVIVESERSSRGDLRIEPDKIDVANAISEAVERARPRAQRRGQNLQATQMALGVSAYGDPRRLAQVLDTVLDNAMRYSERGGEIRLVVEATAEEIAIRVRDTGRGITPDFLPAVFDYFSGRSQPGHGVGVGLAVARRLMELQGGSIRARSSGAGAGSEFTIVLPVRSADHVPGRINEGGASAERHDAKDEPVPPGIDSSTSRVRSSRGRRVLVADDSAAVCNSLSALLQELGHEVRSARDGEEALELAQSWQPDYVLLDIHMPKQNGFMVAKALRSRFSSERMKLVMMSGINLDDAMLAGAKAAGFDNCIDKVFAFSELEKLLASDARGRRLSTRRP
jgi:CheY-like chemotaxis protein